METQCIILKQEPGIGEDTALSHESDRIPASESSAIAAVKMELKNEITIKDHRVQVPEEYLHCSLGNMLSALPPGGLQSRVERSQSSGQELRRTQPGEHEVPLDWKERLVLEVEKRPVLYDPRRKDHSNRLIRASAWEEISAVFNYRLSSNDLQKKWKSLRDRFVREACSRSIVPNNSAGRKHKKRWHLLKKMAFLKEPVAARATIWKWGQKPSTTTSTSAVTAASNYDVTIEVSRKNSTPLPVLNETSRSLGRRRHTPLISPLDALIARQLTRKPHEDVDAVHSFCVSLVPLLRTLDLKKRVAAQIQILKILYDAQD